MSEESVFSLQEIVAYCRKTYPQLLDKQYEKMYKLKDSIDFKKEESLIPKQLPNFNWPENFDYKHIESVPDEKMIAKIKEQMKLMALLQKEEKNPISKILNSVYKNK